MKVLIIGATGMLGYSLFSNLSDYEEYDVYGTVRTLEGKENYFLDTIDNVFQGVDVNDLNKVQKIIEKVKPETVINCIGLIKQHDIAKQHVDAISINALLPHELANICQSSGSKLIHFSTDCVFSGQKGAYVETDLPDAIDLYGRSKCLGEVDYSPHLTLRTSIIGHELNSNVSLIDWFLSEKQAVKGFSKAVFSGLPTCVIGRLLAENILPDNRLTGLYHLSVKPIDKYSLLNLVAEIYEKKIEINKYEGFEIDRSLNSQKLLNEIDINIPSWESLIIEMYNDYKKRYKEILCKN